MTDREGEEGKEKLDYVCFALVHLRLASAEWMNDALYGALLCIAVHPNHFTIMCVLCVGGGGGGGGGPGGSLLNHHQRSKML